MQILTKSFDVKEDKHMLDLMIIHPMLLFIFSDFNLWCFNHQLPVVITNVVNEKIEGISVSNTHAEGRAIDVSVKGWGQSDIFMATSYFNEKYKDYGAIGYKTGKSTVFYYHEGTGFHIHIQVRPDITGY